MKNMAGGGKCGEIYYTATNHLFLIIKSDSAERLSERTEFSVHR